MDEDGEFNAYIHETPHLRTKRTFYARIKTIPIDDNTSKPMFDKTTYSNYPEKVYLSIKTGKTIRKNSTYYDLNTNQIGYKYPYNTHKCNVDGPKCTLCARAASKERRNFYRYIVNFDIKDSIELLYNI